MTTAIAVNILLTVAVVGTVHDIFRIVCPAPDGFDLDRLQRVFTKLSNMNGESRTLVEIQETASTATAGLKQLQRIMKFTSLSRNAITAVPVYLPLQFTVLWDFQILQLLEDWQQKHGHQFRNWLDAPGNFKRPNHWPRWRMTTRSGHFLKLALNTTSSSSRINWATHYSQNPCES